MIKNPSFCTALEKVRENVEKNNKEKMTVACLIAQDGTMLLYDTIEELLDKYFMPAQTAMGLDYPQSFKVDMFVQYCITEARYFFHMSYEYIPVHLATPEMEARIIMWHEALLCQGISITPANKVDHSGEAFMKASQLVLDEEKYSRHGYHYYPGDMEFLKDCAQDALVDRVSYEYNNVGVYCLKLNKPETSTNDPTITFKDCNERPAVIRKPLHGFVDTYGKYMGDSEFEVLVYPDGTAANMSDGWIEMYMQEEVSDEDLQKHIRDIQPYPLADKIITEMTDTDMFMYRLQILRTICIIGNDTAIIPQLITPQQSVFLEGLQELGYIYLPEANIRYLTDLYEMSVSRLKQKTPLPLSSGFAFGGTSYFCSYQWLSPEMKKRVDSVMRINAVNREKYLFDATNEDRLFVISSEAEL